MESAHLATLFAVPWVHYLHARTYLMQANTSIPLQCVKILETTKDNGELWYCDQNLRSLNDLPMHLQTTSFLGLSLQAMFTIYRIARLPEVSWLVYHEVAHTSYHICFYRARVGSKCPLVWFRGLLWVRLCQFIVNFHVPSEFDFCLSKNTLINTCHEHILASVTDTHAP